MKTKTMLMLAFVLSTTLSPVVPVHAKIHKRETSNQKLTGHNVTIGHRAYNALIGQFNQPWPFGPESNED